MAHSIKFEIQWTKRKVSPVYQFSVPKYLFKGEKTLEWHTRSNLKFNERNGRLVQYISSVFLNISNQHQCSHLECNNKRLPLHPSRARMSGLRGWGVEEPIHSPDHRTAPVGKGVVPPIQVFLSPLEVWQLERLRLVLKSDLLRFQFSIYCNFVPCPWWWPPLLWLRAWFDPCVSSSVILSTLVNICSPPGPQSVLAPSHIFSSSVHNKFS